MPRGWIPWRLTWVVEGLHELKGCSAVECYLCVDYAFYLSLFPIFYVVSDSTLFSFSSLNMSICFCAHYYYSIVASFLEIKVFYAKYALLMFDNK